MVEFLGEYGGRGGYLWRVFCVFPFFPSVFFLHESPLISWFPSLIFSFTFPSISFLETGCALVTQFFQPTAGTCLSFYSLFLLRTSLLQVTAAGPAILSSDVYTTVGSHCGSALRSSSLLGELHVRDESVPPRSRCHC